MPHIAEYQMHPKLIIVEGPCGAGKSTAIHSAREVLRHVAFVDLDVIKHRTYALGDWQDWNFTESILGEDWRRSLATEIGFAWISKLQKLRRHIVIELCDTIQIQPRLMDLCAECGYEVQSHLLLPSLEHCLTVNRQRTDSVPFVDEKVRASYSFYADHMIELSKSHHVHTEQSTIVSQIIEATVSGREHR